MKPIGFTMVKPPLAPKNVQRGDRDESVLILLSNSKLFDPGDLFFYYNLIFVKAVKKEVIRLYEITNT